MIALFNDAGDRLPITFNADIILNAPIGGDPLHIYEVNAVFVRDVFSSTTEPRPTEDGTEIYSVRKSAKLVRIDGIIRAPTLSKLADMNADLRGSLDPATLSILDPIGHGVAPLDFTVLSDAGEQASYVICRPVSNPDFMWDQYLGKNCPFRIELYCADPRRYLLASDIYTQVGAGTEPVVNEGNYPSLPEIEITMSGAGNAAFSIQRGPVFGRIDLNLSSTIAGDVIDVYTSEKIVTKNGVRADNLVINSTDWGLDVLPGNSHYNTINASNSTTEITVFHAFSM